MSWYERRYAPTKARRHRVRSGGLTTCQRVPTWYLLGRVLIRLCSGGRPCYPPPPPGSLCRAIATRSCETKVGQP